MKKIMKKLALVSFVVCLVLSMTACGKEAAKVEYKTENIEYITNAIVSGVYSENDLAEPELAKEIEAFESDEELGALRTFITNKYRFDADGAAIKSGLASYIAAVEEIGPVTDVSKNIKISADDEEVIADVILTGTNKRNDGSTKTAEMEIILSKKMKVTSIAFNVEKTFPEKLTNAALNTVLGMGTTFVVLIFISLVIWLMGTIVTNAQKKSEAPKAASKPAAPAAPAAAPAASAAAPADAADDQELIAVIAAAIAAYESEATGVNVSPDTFVVRSLRRR